MNIVVNIIKNRFMIVRVIRECDIKSTLFQERYKYPLPGAVQMALLRNMGVSSTWKRGTVTGAGRSAEVGGRVGGLMYVMVVGAVGGGGVL